MPTSCGPGTPNSRAFSQPNRKNYKGFCAKKWSCSAISATNDLLVQPAWRALGVAKVYPNVPFFDFGCERRLFHALSEFVLTRGHIKLPAVPRASDYAAPQSSLAYRAPLVRANAVQGVKRISHSAKGHHSVFKKQLLCNAVRQLFCDNCLYPFFHSEKITQLPSSETSSKANHFR